MMAPEDIAKLPSNKLGIREPIENLRQDILNVGKAVHAQKEQNAPVQQISNTEDRGEAVANLMLAYRHLEDARMRLGKVLQAADGGVSVYDK